MKNGILDSVDITPEPLPAKIIAVKPNMALRIVITDGRIAMYFNLCFRTRLSKLFLADSLFDFDIFCISKFVFYERRKARFYFIAYLHEALRIFADRQIQFCSGTEFYHTKPFAAS